ncbi:MAG: hypothetical protein R3B06_21150 [Kofleriaceae bacterium]
MRRCLGLVAAMVSVTTLAGTAAADDPAARQAVAAALVDAASAAQARGDYPAAIEALHAAYALIPHPELLYNLGQAHRLADEPWAAIDEYERYLSVEPKGRFAAKARQYLAALAKQTAGQSRPVEPPPPPPPAPPLPAPPAPPVAAVRPDDAVAAPLDEPAPRSSARWRRPTALALGAVGLAGVGLGAYAGLRARSISDELSANRGPWTDALLATQADGERAERRAIVGLTVGGALVVTGVVLWVTGRGRGERAVAVAPVVDPRGAGVVVGGAF